MRTAVYPGSFDPITNGHLDIIERAANIFDRVIVALLVNCKKSYLFDLNERIYMIRQAVKHLSNVEVDSFNGLLVDYVKSAGATAVVKGLRAVSDFEYEFQMALMNRKLNPGVETVFMMTNYKYSFLSSSIVKEVARMGGPVNDLIPPVVAEFLYKKFGPPRRGLPAVDPLEPGSIDYYDLLFANLELP